MIDRDEIIKLAGLSKLTLSDDEIETLTADMQSIVSFADKICNVNFYDADGICAENLQPLRDDKVTASYSQETILKNAPTSENGFFKLPRRGE